MATPQCGAKAKSTGNPCTRAVKKGGRCRFHGGRSTGPKTKAGKARSARRATKTGIYSANLNDKDREWLEGISESGLDQEIKLARLQINRALAAWEKWEGENPEQVLPAIESTQTTDAKGHQMAEVHRRRPDLWAIIDRALGRVGRLVEQNTRIVEFKDLQEEVRLGLLRAKKGEPPKP